MHQSNMILMRAAKERIFETAADLEQWPKFLPHYRYIHYFERSPTRAIVKMAARRGPIPISWVSEEVIDRDRWEVRFTHLKAWTKGMVVIWNFEQRDAGEVQVSIVHDLAFQYPLLAPVAEPVISQFFIDYVATRTLQRMKDHVEKS